MTGTGAAAAQSDGPAPARSLLEAALALAAEQPRHPVLAWGGAEVTVSGLLASARGLAGTLRAAGAGPGDRVAVACGNGPGCIAAWLAVAWVGAVEVSVSTLLRGDSLRAILDDADPALVLADASMTDELLAVRRDGRERIVPIEQAAAGSGAGAAAEPAPADPRELGAILYTSGTTGRSKGVMWSPGSWMAHASLWARMMGLCPADRLHFAQPLFHADGHIAVAAAVIGRSTLVLAPRFRASRFWQEVRQNRVTVAMSTGAALAALAHHRPSRHETGTGPLRIWGGPVPAIAYEVLEDRLGVQLYEVYGQTEADSVAFSTPQHRRRGSCGRPCDLYEVAIVDSGGTPVPPGAEGEIAYRPRRGNLLFLGYWRNDAATVQRWRDLWHRSGDRGILDDDGYLWFRGRLGDSIRHRGENVPVFEMEELIRRCPGVADCAAVAVPDDIGVEDDIKLYLTTSPGWPFDPAVLLAFCRKHLPKYAIPRYVEVVAERELDRAPGNGTIVKRTLPRTPGERSIDLRRLAGEGRGTGSCG